MARARSVGLLTLVSCAAWLVAGCSKSGDGSGAASNSTASSGSGPEFSGTYVSVDAAELTAQFKSDGTVVFTMGSEQGAPGTYSVEGEKIIVNMEGQLTTFIRDGDCIRDNQDFFGTLCKGGKEGAATNVSTREIPAPAGTWSATNADGEFTIEFKAGGAMSMNARLADGSTQSTDGRFEVEGDTVYITLADSTPMVLKFVNNSYESSSFGLPMTFTRK
jgi:hypothetical protein